MIEGIAKNIAALTLLGLLYTATFNVGYFAAFGAHFIGVMDASNFVNSFAFLLIFIALLVAIILFIGNYFLTGQHIWEKSVRVAWVLAAMAIMLVAGYLIFKDYVLGALLIGVSYVSAFAAGAFLIYGQWADTRRLKIQWLSVLFIGSLLGLAVVGRAFGEQQKLSGRLYTFATKGGNIVGAAMLRASSNGFLISVNGQVQFIASSEVRSVIEERPSP
jgi:hypothetical protein